jgi:uncharacterized glyoxalase superfamily protein PhnB
MTPILKVIGVVTADMGKTLAFYRQLGLDIPASADSEPHVDVPLSGGISLAFDTIETIHSFDAGWTEPTGGPRVGLAFDCGTPDEVDRVHADMTGAGYESHKEPWDAFWGMRYAVLHDPNGNGVDLFASLA